MSELPSVEGSRARDNSTRHEENGSQEKATTRGRSHQTSPCSKKSGNQPGQ